MYITQNLRTITVTTELLFTFNMITARQGRYGKVMFSDVFVCSQGGRGPMSMWPLTRTPLARTCSNLLNLVCLYRDPPPHFLLECVLAILDVPLGISEQVSYLLSIIFAAISAPTPNCGHPPSTVTKWLVFITELIIVSSSMGLIVLKLITCCNENQEPMKT